MSKNLSSRYYVFLQEQISSRKKKEDCDNKEEMLQLSVFSCSVGSQSQKAAFAFSFLETEVIAPSLTPAGGQKRD